MSQKKRKPAAKLVSDAVPAKSGKPWQEQLSLADRLYVRNIVMEMISNPEAAPYVVARNLIKELSIKRSVGTVTRTLKEMIRDAQQKA